VLLVGNMFLRLGRQRDKMFNECECQLYPSNNTKAEKEANDKEKCKLYLQKKLIKVKDVIDWQSKQLKVLKETKRNLETKLNDPEIFEAYYNSTEWCK
jgi:hypothetical protein